MLSERERDVLRLISEGATYAEVAKRLGISTHTVTSHIKNCYRKLGVRRAADAVARAVELKLLEKR
ncbi:MAG: response regulator transcription factor [Burkholderiales bacterium]